ncbi:MAG: global nitrogen regulator NrpRII [Methanoculleus sp.]|nr:global nitrogen regulator NrpRII [Methanoculleus sp.]
MHSPLKFTNHRIEEYALRVTYRPEEDAGTIIYNLSLIESHDLEFALSIIKEAHKAGITISDRILIAAPGEQIGDYTVPDGKHAVCTMCSITLDALLLRRGIPINPIGGGIVEVEGRVPRRFTSMILYRDTTLDPLEVLISQETTSILDVMRRRDGNILANIRECHMEAEPLMNTVLDELTAMSFSGILDVGVPNVPLLGVPVSPQYVGVAMVGGTNAMAAVKETGRSVVTKALKGLIDIREMGYLEDY